MPPDTKERILDSAELLFAQHGVAATSLRALTAHANVNLAAVNYHFQSKDALVQAVLSRRLNPINARRMAMLKEILARSAGGLPDLEEILDAFYRPPVEAVIASRKEGRSIIALMGRIFTEPGELVASQVRAMMSDVAAAFLDAFQKAQPEAPQKVLYWRLHFTVGALTHIFGASHLVEGLSRGRVQVNDTEEILRQIISYAAGGIRGSLP